VIGFLALRRPWPPVPGTHWWLRRELIAAASRAHSRVYELFLAESVGELRLASHVKSVRPQRDEADRSQRGESNGLNTSAKSAVVSPFAHQARPSHDPCFTIGRGW
jgi:hypothetical protein